MKVIIIDDDALVTSGIKLIVENSTRHSHQPIQVVGVGSDGSQALDLYRHHHPDLVLMDIRMKEVNGIEAGQAILKEYPKARIIFLTTFLEDEYIISALKIGAKGYILKTDYQTLVPAIEAVMNDQSVFGNEITSRMPHYLNQAQEDSQLVGDLSERESTLLYHIAQGLNNREIADTMHFSQGTVRNYISDLLTKLDLRDRTQLAIYYYKNLSD